MDNYCSPQWVDFTSTPDVPSDDYFEKNHEIYKYKPCAEEPEIKVTSEDKVNNKELSEVKTNNEDLELELNIIKNTPIKVIYSPSSIHKRTKCKLTKKITYDDVLNEAIKTFEHCGSVKLNTFKKPAPIPNDVLESLKCHVADNNEANILSNLKIQEVTDGKPNQEIKSLSSINPCNSDTSLNDSLKNDEFNCKTDIASKQEQCLLSERDNSNKQLKPVTYQCRRQSVVIRRRSNQFISLAAAVHKFQNETPERFHTKCNKDLKMKTASAKRHSFVTRKAVFTKSNIKRRSVPALSQKEEKHSKSDKMTELPCSKISPKIALETPNTTKPRRSCLNFSTKISARNKHVVSTIVDNNTSEIVLKKEKILFFDIPIHTKQKTTTRPIPFSFEYRDKLKKQSESKQLEFEDNKSVNNVKFQNIETKILGKKIRTGSIGVQNKAQSSTIEKSHHSKPLKTNGEACKVLGTINTLKNNSHIKSKNDEKNLASTSQNLKATMKTNKSRSMSSLKPYKKTEEKNEKNEHSSSKDTEQLKKQSTSMCSKNSFDNKKDKMSKEKIKNGNKKVETIPTKEDLNKMKRKSSTSNSANTNTATQENKCPNIDASTSDQNLSQTKNVKSKSVTIGMHSYERGKQRHEFDERIKEKIKMQEEEHKKMQADKLAQEKLQIAKLRKQLEVKAKPIPLYKPFLPNKSTKPLTEPQSPAWGYKNKMKKTT